jgi:hypothetical protein
MFYWRTNNECTFNITTGPPSEPAGVYKDETSLTTSSIVVEWKAAGNNGDPIMAYVIEGFNYWEGFWKILKTSKWSCD